MPVAQLQRIEEIFRAALDQRPDRVGVFLEIACEGDEHLRREVEALLASHRAAGSFIEDSAVGLATKIIENGRVHLLAGQTVGHYKISKRIGAGGMGEVYLATDITAGRKAALKILPARFTGDAERLKRFRQEARAVVALNHPNILTVYEIGEDHAIHYIASELIEGESLRDRLARGRMGLNEAVDVAIQVASALVAAHEAGIVHRDIKPENIMLRPDGYVKVFDFGIAKLGEREVPATVSKDEALLLVETNLGSVLGTVYYMSPEQAYGTPIDKRTDIWSLGVVLYEMVAGHAPFTGETAKEAMHSILEKEPPPLGNYIKRVPAELQQIVSKALRKDRRERYQSAGELLQALKNLRRKLESKAELARSTPWLRWTRSPTAVALVLLLAALAFAFPFYRHRNATSSSISEKSIAVLPFENFSDDKEHAFFADGVQDDILIKLAKIADLKVISRTSVMQYRGKQDVHQIGNALGVSHVLEGTVRRSGGKVHINAQLVDTRTDAGIWAEEYDRDLNDVFSIESEVAQSIANRLRAKVSAREKLAMQEWPTKDLVAYDFYVRAVSIIYSAQVPTEAGLVNLSDAVDLLNKAVARDANFFLAYCQLAFLHDLIYQQEIDHTPARLALAKSAIDSAFRLRPDSAEAHLALSWHLYWGYADFDSARTELALAKQNLTNNPRAFELAGLIDRRQGRWVDATQNLERACERDPRNLPYHITLATTYLWLHDYDQMAKVMDHIIVLRPDRKLPRLIRAGIERDGRADTGPLRAVIEKILTNEPGSDKDPDVTSWRFDLALSDRDLETAASIAAALPLKQTRYAGFNQGSRDFWLGVVARLKGDVAAARAAFVRARTETEEELRVHPDDIGLLSDLGLIDAALGRKQEALSEGRRAMELAPTVQEAMTGWSNNEGFARAWFAIICAWAGETDLALEQLEAVTKIPGGPNYGELRLNPMWDPLRGDPRFEKIVVSLAPKDAKQ